MKKLAVSSELVERAFMKANKLLKEQSAFAPSTLMKKWERQRDLFFDEIGKRRPPIMQKEALWKELILSTLLASGVKAQSKLEQALTPKIPALADTAKNITWAHAPGSAAAMNAAKEMNIDGKKYKLYADTIKEKNNWVTKETINQLAFPVEEAGMFSFLGSSKEPMRLFKTETKSPVGTGREQWVRPMDYDEGKKYLDGKKLKGLLKKGQ